MYTTDPLFGSNLMVGCQIQFPWGASHPTSTWTRSTPSPFRFVERNYNVIVERANSISNNLTAIDPLTNTPYSIEQVSSSAGAGGNGTAANPFATVAQAQSAGNVILVQGNSVFNTPVTLTNGQFLLGDGTTQRIPLAGSESIGIPAVIPGSQAPQFINITGTAVTLASNSIVSGFNFSNVSQNAVAGSGINNGTISDNVFQNIGADAISLSSSTGNFVITGNTINGTGGDGIALANLSGGSLNIGSNSVTSTTGAGLLMNAVNDNVTVDSLSTSKTTGPAVSISGGASDNTYHFTGITNIQQPTGVGFSLNGSAATLAVDNLVVNSSSTTSATVSLTNSTGPVTLSSLNLNTNGGAGLTASSLGSLTISNGTITSVGAPALDLVSTPLNVKLAQVSVNGGPYGITLAQDSGTFNITGSNASGTGGTIQNTTTGLILNTPGTITLNWLDLASNGVGIQSTGNNTLKLSDLQITGSTGYALDGLGDPSVSILNSVFSGNGASGGGTIRLQANTVATYSWTLQGNTINDASGTPILLATQAAGAGATLSTTVEQNTITGSAAGNSLLNINWNGPMTTVVTTNNLAAASGANMTGITVQDTSTTTTSGAENININTNTINVSGTQSTGIMVAAAGSNTIQVNTNTIGFTATGGTALQFNLTASGTSYITNNQITDKAGGMTGMLFDNVAAGTTVEIYSNTLTFLANDPNTPRGIIFSNATPTINLLSLKNNVINNAPANLFSIPSNSSTGDIAINGVAYP